ncbi:MAG: hypothetical protein JWN33_565 [Candidatus Saccharibacteria bacterium]|nr:hypothetical protein [Candidatus Saccharibacteria bacterium]
MTTTVKITLKRFKQILAININSFTLSAVATLFLLGLLAWYNPEKLFDISIPDLYNAILPSMILIIFVVPICILLTSFISERLRGLSETKIDYARAKKSLFNLAGSLWICLGFMLFLSLADVEKYYLTVIVAGLLTLFSWYYICRILISYVKS